MHEEEARPRRARKKPAVSALYSLGYIALALKDGFLGDLSLSARHFRMVAGVMLIILGVLTVDSAAYCDNGALPGPNCTRPAAYYYFDVSSIALAAAGAVLVTLAAIRQREYS